MAVIFTGHMTSQKRYKNQMKELRQKVFTTE